MNTRNHAVHVVPRLGPETDAGDTVVQLQITRPAAIRAFSWFMVAIMGVISLSVVLAVVAVITGRRRAELSMLGWSTALLFALPAVRNNLPGAPPLGALIDYSVFFWAEALVGLSMIMLLAFWFSVKETPD